MMRKNIMVVLSLVLVLVLGLITSGCNNLIKNDKEIILGANYDSGRSYLYGYQIPGFMTGLSGMGYSLLRDINKELPCILSLEI